MDETLRHAAEAFSHHDFSSTYDHLTEDVRWRNVGGEEHSGKPAVIAACDTAASYFAGVRTSFIASRTIIADHAVIVESSAAYVDGDDPSTVASCDVYDVIDGKITVITSYNVQL